MRLVPEALKERGCEPRFADTGFTGKQHHLAFGIICPRPASQQYFELFFPANERGQARRVQSFKSTLHGTRPKRRPCPRRPSDAFELPGPEVLELEQIAEKSAGSLGDEDHVRLGDAL